VVESDRPAERRYEPGHPMADDDGYIYASNVDTIEEMTNMMSASQSYQSNIELLNTARQLMLKTLKLGE
jgi:flagellar basal-body rod protein FlgC